jgi:NAD(P)-dependent dehydrogenase (short-subunit alcohol dehydrogenase family)
MGSGRLEGKRAVITGAGMGMGRAAAIRFAREGAKVGLIDLNEAATQETVQVIAAEGGEALALIADVTNEDQVAGAVGTAVARWGGLDVVVANAAVQLMGQDARVHELDAAVWQQTIAINLTGVFHTCKHGIRALLASGGGSVICTASPTSLLGLAPGFDAYTASKAGVLGLVKVMANDYARDGIRVNAVIPGFTDTPMVRQVMENDQWRESLIQTIPMGRPGRPEEVAAMMVFLASDEASYATGGAFFVDGGITAV